MFLRKSIEGRTRTKADEDGIWSDEKRIEAVAIYIALGSMAETHKATGIPLNTLWSWKQRKSWWEDVEKALRAEHNNQTSSKLSGIVDKTLAAIVERVESGDWVYNQRSGEITRVPVSAAALNKIASALLDRRLVLDKMEMIQQEDEVDTTAKLEKQLARLAHSFSDFVASRKREEKVIDMEQVNA
jgi:transposase-like protein